MSVDDGEVLGPPLVTVSTTPCVLPAAAVAGALIASRRSAPVLTVVVSLCELPPTREAVTVMVPAACVRTRTGTCTVLCAGTSMPEQVTVPGPAWLSAMPLHDTPAGSVPVPA